MLQFGLLPAQKRRAAGLTGQSSVIPTGLSGWNPYAATDEAKTKRVVPAAAAARTAFSVPSILVARRVGAASRAGDQEREVDHDVGTPERPPEAGRIADVAPPVLHLVPAVVDGSNGRRAMPIT